MFLCLFIQHFKICIHIFGTSNATVGEHFFEIIKISAEQAHEIGQQLADEWLKGKHEYVLATHVDKDHIHNHIIFNAVSFVDHHAYRSNKRTYHELREVSDKICAESGLSVIPPTQGKGMDYKEYFEAKQSTSWKQKLRFAIDKNIMFAKDFDDFLRLMQESGYEIKSGKYISFRAEGQERFTRAKTIGDNYTEERIRERISGRRGRILPTERKGISLIIDIQNSIKAQQSKGFEHWAKVNNLKQAAKTLNYLTENNLLQYSDLEGKVAELRAAFSANSESLKSVEGRLREIQPLIKNLNNYHRLKLVWNEYSHIKNKPAFREKHQAELMIFEAARNALREHYGERKWDSLKELQAERSKLTAEQDRLYAERERIKKQLKEVETVRGNVDKYLEMRKKGCKNHMRFYDRKRKEKIPALSVALQTLWELFSLIEDDFQAKFVKVKHCLPISQPRAGSAFHRQVRLIRFPAARVRSE